MIVNELTYSELLNLLRPILQLSPPEIILSNFKNILRIEIQTRDDIICQTQFLLKYKEYKIDIRDLRCIENKGMSIGMQFKAKKKWWHGIFKDQNLEIVADLKQICFTEIQGLQFGKFTPIAQPDCLSSEAPARLVYFYDSRAFNPNWKAGHDISPLLISPDAHHGKCFTEFQFNAGGYIRMGGKTVLRDDWTESAFDISEGIERGARGLLGLE